MRSSLVLVAAVATLAACAESPTQTADYEPDFARSENAQGVAGSASGSGQSLCAPPAPPLPGPLAAFEGVAYCGSDVLTNPLVGIFFPDLEKEDLKLRTFSFSAQLLADGSARGKAQWNNRSYPQAWDVDISCAAFNPLNSNQVWFGGTLTRGYGQAPAPAGIEYAVGAEVIFAVEDNGEGSGADTDRILGFGTTPPGFAGAVCAGEVPWDGPFGLSAFFEGSNFDPIRGNIQVRPPSSG